MVFRDGRPVCEWLFPILLVSPWQLTDLNRLLGRPLSVEEVDQCLPSARAQAANVWHFVQSIKGC